MEIETSARLHLSLIDLNGLEGRIDGGIGITLNDPSLVLECKPTNLETQIFFDKKIVSCDYFKEYESKIMFAYKKMQDYLDIHENYIFKVKEIYPIHHGLGLGTQLLLSAGKLVSKLNDVDLNVNELAKIVQRGGTSGIGVYSFDKGGFIVDGGHKNDIKTDFLPSSASYVEPPPLLARYDFPKDWNIILATPDVAQGAYGKNEVDIFQSYSPIDVNDVEKICYITLMKLMPAVLEEDIGSFGSAINKIQELGFKNIERSLQSEKINDTINYMLDNGVACAGMSSFGPICFGITDTNAKDIKKDIEEFMGNQTSVILTKGKNKGSIIK